MFPKFFILVIALHILQAEDLPDTDKLSEVVVHATNNSLVPSAYYLVDAVECLKEAFTVYTEPQDITELYAELFQEKHSESQWSVVGGYTSAYIRSKYYVETNVTTNSKDKKDSKDNSTLYLIFTSL